MKDLIKTGSKKYENLGARINIKLKVLCVLSANGILEMRERNFI